MRRNWLLWLRRYWLLILVMIAFIVFLIIGFQDIERVVAALLQGLWPWVLAATLTQSVYYLLYAVQYRLAFATVEVQSQLGELVPVMFASIFLRTVVPSGGVSGAALFIDDAARRGQSPARAAEGALLVLTIDLGTMVPLILYALAYLSLRGSLRAYEVLGSAIFVLFVGGLVGALLLGRWQPGLLRRLFGWLETAANWLAHQFGRSDLLPPGWGRGTAADLTRAANDVATHKERLQRTVAVGFAAQLVNLVTVEAVARAYRQPLSFGALVASFSLEAVFSVVTFIPHGLVVAEAVMVMVLTGLGIGLDTAVLITLVYRGLSVWLPLFVGFLLLRRVRTFGGGRRAGDA